MALLALLPHDAPGAEGCAPLLPDGPGDTPLVRVGAGVDPDRVDPPCREVPGGSGHVVLDYAGAGASELVLSAARMEALAGRLDSAHLVVMLPHPDRLLVSTPHPVAVALLGSLGGAAYDVVARNGGPRLSRRLYLVSEGRIVAVYEPGTLAARRAIGVSARRAEAAEAAATVAPAATVEPPVAPTDPQKSGVLGWWRRVTGA